MTQQEREELIDYCVSATAELNGVFLWEVDRKDFDRLTDEQLEAEADWLDEMLDK